MASPWRVYRAGSLVSDNVHYLMGLAAMIETMKMLLLLLAIAFALLCILIRVAIAGEMAYTATYWDFEGLNPGEKRTKDYLIPLPKGTHHWTHVKYIDEPIRPLGMRVVAQLRDPVSGSLLWEHEIFGSGNGSVLEPIQVGENLESVQLTQICKNLTEAIGSCGGKVILFAKN